MAATGEGKDRRGDYQETLADASSPEHPGLGGSAGVAGTGRCEAAGGGHGPRVAGEHRCPRGTEGARPGPGLLPDGPRLTGRIAGLVPVPARELTWAGEPLRRSGSECRN